VLQAYKEKERGDWRRTRWLAGNLLGRDPKSLMRLDDEKTGSGIRELFKIAKDEREHN
jgi:hypothetical protein